MKLQTTTFSRPSLETILKVWSVGNVFPPFEPYILLTFFASLCQCLSLGLEGGDFVVVVITIIIYNYYYYYYRVDSVATRHGNAASSTPATSQQSTHRAPLESFPSCKPSCWTSQVESRQSSEGPFHNLISEARNPSCN